METKQAAANPIYIILFSQSAGSILGTKINKRISAKGVEKLFFILMVIIIGVNIYNIKLFLT